MVTKELNSRAIRIKLIEIYSKYLESKQDKCDREKAKQIYWDFTVGAQHFLDKACHEAVWQAIYIYTGELSIKTAKKILEKIKS